MRSINDQLKQRLAGETTHFATCLRLKRKDGTVFGFTDHINDVFIENLNYQADSGFFSSAIENTASLAVDNLEVGGFLNAASIKNEDITAGLYDHAYVEIFVVDYTALDLGEILLKTGYLGEIKLLNNQFVAEVRGLSEKLSNNIGKLYSPTCRAEFCGSECKIVNSQHFEYGAVSEVINKTCIKSKDLHIENYLYNIGSIKFISGKNKDLSILLKKCKGSTVTFLLEFPNAIKKGDKFILYAGCDKKIETCCNIYNNALNFRGEPHLPGTDEILKTAGTFR